MPDIVCGTKLGRLRRSLTTNQTSLLPLFEKLGCTATWSLMLEDSYASSRQNGLKIRSAPTVHNLSWHIDEILCTLLGSTLHKIFFGQTPYWTHPFQVCSRHKHHLTCLHTAPANNTEFLSYKHDPTRRSTQLNKRVFTSMRHTNVASDSASCVHLLHFHDWMGCLRSKASSAVHCCRHAVPLHDKASNKYYVPPLTTTTCTTMSTYARFANNVKL